ncbi:MAG: 50S ribosomal protein L10 [Chlamydiae bacterium]|nr:50S ribosomal protein L10 [Chlamydiota bacterium]
MRKEKQLFLDELQEQIDHYGSFVIMSYLGLDANQMHQFRKKIREVGGNIKMVPKRMFMIASDKSGFKLDLDMLTGHIGVVFASDPIETTKAVFECQKEATDDKLKVVGGCIDGEILDSKAMIELSKLPSKQELRAQFVGLLQAPLVQTVSVMNALVSSVVYCLDNKCKKEEGQS